VALAAIKPKAEPNPLTNERVKFDIVYFFLEHKNNRVYFTGKKNLEKYRWIIFFQNS
jgi:hypothetical protein